MASGEDSLVGFKRIYSKENPKLTIGCKCLLCQRKFKKKDAKFREKHRKGCLSKEHASPNTESISPLAQPPQPSASCDVDAEPLQKRPKKNALIEIKNRKVDIAPSNLAAAHDLNVEEMKTTKWNCLFKALDSSYEFPSVTEFKTTILENSYGDMVYKRSKEKFIPIIYVYGVKLNSPLKELFFIISCNYRGKKLLLHNKHHPRRNVDKLYSP